MHMWNKWYFENMIQENLFRLILVKTLKESSFWFYRSSKKYVPKPSRLWFVLQSFQHHLYNVIKYSGEDGNESKIHIFMCIT